MLPRIENPINALVIQCCGFIQTKQCIMLTLRSEQKTLVQETRHGNKKRTIQGWYCYREY